MGWCYPRLPMETDLQVTLLIRRVQEIPGHPERGAASTISAPGAVKNSGPLCINREAVLVEGVCKTPKLHTVTSLMFGQPRPQGPFVLGSFVTTA